LSGTLAKLRGSGVIVLRHREAPAPCLVAGRSGKFSLLRGPDPCASPPAQGDLDAVMEPFSAASHGMVDTATRHSAATELLQCHHDLPPALRHAALCVVVSLPSWGGRALSLQTAGHTESYRSGHATPPSVRDDAHEGASDDAAVALTCNDGHYFCRYTEASGKCQWRACGKDSTGLFASVLLGLRHCDQSAYESFVLQLGEAPLAKKIPSEPLRDHIAEQFACSTVPQVLEARSFEMLPRFNKLDELTTSAREGKCNGDQVAEFKKTCNEIFEAAKQAHETICKFEGAFNEFKTGHCERECARAPIPWLDGKKYGRTT
jgi:hypothetical protein